MLVFVLSCTFSYVKKCLKDLPIRQFLNAFIVKNGCNFDVSIEVKRCDS